MLRRIKRGLGFIRFTLASVRPLKRALFLIAGKFMQRLAGLELKKINFRLVRDGLDTEVAVNDMEQYTYLFNIFYREPFRVTCGLGENPAIVDGGANIGAASLYYKWKYPGAEIYAFEPSGANAEILKRNLSSIENARVERKALWDESGTLTFNISNCPRYHSFFERDGMLGTEEVEAASLGDWLEKNGLGGIDVLKLNVEGAELRTVRGLGGRIAETRVIVGELHPEFVDEEEFVNELTRNGFRLVRLEKAGKSVSVFEAHNGRYSP